MTTDAGGAGVPTTSPLSRSTGTHRADRDVNSITHVQHRSTITPLTEAHMPIDRTNQDEPQNQPQGDESQDEVQDLQAKTPQADEQVKGGAMDPSREFGSDE